MYRNISKSLVLGTMTLLVVSIFATAPLLAGVESNDEDLQIEQPSLDSTKGRTEYLVSLTPAPNVNRPSDLRSHAQDTQDDLLRFVESNEGIDVLNTFWLTNVVSLSVDTDLLSLSTLLKIDHVERVYEPPEIEVIETVSSLSTGSNDVSLSSDSLNSEQDYTYGLEQMNVPEAWDEHNTQGEGVSVAVLDTGVDVEHPDLEVDKWAHFDGDGEPVDSDAHDGHGHGTNVSGVIVGPENPDGDVPAYGVAPEADHWGVKVLDDSGTGTFDQIIAGMEWSVSEGADVMSMSFGASGYYDQLIDPVVNSIFAGTTVVAMVGNSGEGNSVSPGNIYDAIGVGASDKTEEIADFSSGENIETDDAWEDPPDHWPDEYIVPSVTAPGVDVLSSSARGGYEEQSSTGMSAAYVSGVVALVQSATEENLEHEVLEEALEQSAFKPDDWDPPAGERDTRYGSGIIDAQGTIDYLMDEEYTLTVNIEGEGTVTDHEDFEFQDGETKEYTEMTEVDLTATADENWYFADWTGDYEGTEEEITITMDENKEITANFEDELEIYDWHDLDNTRSELEGDYILMNDLDENTDGYQDLVETTAGWEPIGNETDPFVGTFDGNDHTISDLYINRSTEEHVGLFGHTESGSEIRDTHLIGLDVTGEQRVGGLVGYNDGLIVNSSASGSVEADDGWYNGVLIGYNYYSSEVISSYSSGVVEGPSGLGGLSGINYGTIYDSYSTAEVAGTERNIGGLVGELRGDIINSYSTGEVTGNSRVGGLVGRFGSGSVEDSFWDTETSGQDTSAGDATGKTTAEMKDVATYTDTDTEGLDDPWDFVGDPNDDEGDEDTWHIDENFNDGYPVFSWESLSIYDWYGLDAVRHHPDGDYTVMNDLHENSDGYDELVDTNDGWDPIGTFNGDFDGNGYKIQDLYIDRPSQNYVGLFGRIEGSTIENLKVSGEVYGNQWVGGLVGFITSGETTIKNVVAQVDVGGSDEIGGLVGVAHNGNRIIDSAARGSVDGPVDANIGGLVGRIHHGDVIIENTYAVGQVNQGGPGDDVGGLIGYKHDDAQVLNSFWDVDTTGQSESDGGTGKSTEEMKDVATFTDLETEGLDEPWDFVDSPNDDNDDEDIWDIDEEEKIYDGYPFLSWEEFGLMDIELTKSEDADDWNFISFDLIPVDPSLETILEDEEYGITGSYEKVMYYDASEDQWMSYMPGRDEHFNDLDTWDNTMGIWIQMDQDDTLTIKGDIPSSTEIVLEPGWNMVGYPSGANEFADETLPDEVSKIGLFSEEAEYNIEYLSRSVFDSIVIQPGRGYWVFNEAEEPVTWTVGY